jgi:4-amino-4-deoxy-L-arabinose transferase-like glycosyltransferase
MLLAVALAAVVIRLAVSAAFKGHSYVAAEPVKPETEATYLKRGEIGLGDSEQYLLLGAGIRHRMSYSWNGEPNTFRTPGYPLLLAVLNNNIAAIVIVQALLAGLTVFLVGFIGLRLFNLRVGLLGAGLLAVDVPSIFSAGMVMSEVLFTFAVVLAAALVAWRPSDEGERGNGEGAGQPKSDVRRQKAEGRSVGRASSAVAAGFVLGFAVLVRPVALLAFVPFGIALAARRNWRGLVLMLVAFSLLPGIWMARNYYHYHRFSLTSNGGYNLLYANAAAVLSDEQHVSWDSARIELARDFTSRLATNNPLELADLMTRKATSIILHDPLRYVWVCLRGVPKVIAGIKSDDLVLRTLAAKVPAIQGSVLLNREPGSSGVKLAIVLLAGFELLTAIGGFLLALASLGFRRWRAEKLLLVLIGLYFVAAALPFTDGRFRVPAMPFFYLAAATVLAGRSGSTLGGSRD